MTIAKVVRATAVAVIGLSLSGGVAAAQTGTITDTGPDSWNKIKFHNSDEVKVENNNDLSLDNSNVQKASTGDASVKHNTTGGAATTGAAANDNALDVTGAVDNSSSSAPVADPTCGCDSTAAIDNTGPDSHNEVTFENKSEVKVKNNNNITVTNTNTQKATSGDAKVYDNTTAGDATSGDASNANSTTISLSVTN